MYWKEYEINGVVLYVLQKDAGSPLLTWNDRDNSLKIVGVFSISSHRSHNPFFCAVRISVFENYINMKMKSDLHPEDYEHFKRERERKARKKATSSNSRPHHEENNPRLKRRSIYKY